MGVYDCSSEYQQFAMCSTGGLLDEAAQVSCTACTDLLINEMYHLIDTSDELFVLKTECAATGAAVCLALDGSCLQGSCQACAFYYEPYLLCELTRDSQQQGLGCSFLCDGSPVTAKGPCPPMMDRAAMGLASLAILYLARRMA